MSNPDEITSNIQIFNGEDFISDNSFLFPAGEVGMRLDTTNYRFRARQSDVYVILAYVKSSDDLFRIAMAKDALERMVGYEKQIILYCPYFPYARQDRVCNKGESFSLKVICDYINYLNFNRVVIVDPHSTVTEALINKVKVITQFDIIREWELPKELVMRDFYAIVSPDAGANKKTSEIAYYFDHRSFIHCDKRRDLSNGQIQELLVHCDDLNGQNVIIFDDLCDGGGTFVGLAQKLKEKGCNKVVLYVTHGIFSKGFSHILEHIDAIYTTDSYLARKDVKDPHALINKPIYRFEIFKRFKNMICDTNFK